MFRTLYKMLDLRFLLNKGYKEEEICEFNKLQLFGNQIDAIDERLFEACSNILKNYTYRIINKKCVKQVEINT